MVRNVLFSSTFNFFFFRIPALSFRPLLPSTFLHLAARLIHQGVDTHETNPEQEGQYHLKPQGQSRHANRANI